MAFDRSRIRMAAAAVTTVALVVPVAMAGSALAAPATGTVIPAATVTPSASTLPGTIPVPSLPALPTVGPKPTTKPVPTPTPTPTPKPTSILPSVRPTTLPAGPGTGTTVLAAPVSYKVTFAARWCPTYGDIFANKARNNIMESLQNLGPDTNYSSGEAVNPAREDASPQSNCTPLTGWNFQLGTGINGKTPGTNLSRVSSPGQVVTTTSGVPELDASGNSTGRTIAAATTITLTQEQVNQAANHTLWVQGGTASDPLGQADFPGTFGFGALRCANDNLNGDNVEYVNFTSSQKHVFCYYYSVKPPPAAGVIVIKKALAGIASSDVTFNFGGNTSFNPGGAFSLKGGQSTEFVRGASADTGFDWTVNETIPADWRLVISCTAKGSSTTKLQGNNGVAITLAAGDTVTCTFTNSPNPPPNTLEIGKFADGADGSFGYTVKTPSGTTLGSGSVNVADGKIGSMGKYDVTATGTYKVIETVPAAASGTWALTEVRCQGAVGKVLNATTATIEITSFNARSGIYCVLVNTFTPNSGSITVRSLTAGAAGGDSTYTVARSVTPPGDPVLRFNQRAVNSAADVVATATPITAADATTKLDPTTYTISGFGPVATSAGTWTLSSLACVGGTTGTPDLVNGIITVTLPARGTVTCDYTWTLKTPSTLVVTKAEVLNGGVRTTDVVIDVTCSNGTLARLVVRPTESLPASLPALTFSQSTTCTVTETAPGGNPVSTAWRVTGPQDVSTGSGPTATVTIDHVRNPGAHTATLTNTYLAGSATPTPTVTPTPGPTDGGSTSPSPTPSATSTGPDDREEQVPVKPPTLPEVINPDGPTVILPEKLPTNAGQDVRVTMYCTPRLSLRSLIVPRGDVRTCYVRQSRSGEVTLVVNYPGPIRVFAVLSAPGTATHKPYLSVKTWVTTP